MKIAVLSDIHGNLEALEAVVTELKRSDVDHVVVLGDLVGYGPDPEKVVKRVIKEGYQSVLGNHEAALSSARDRGWMNFQTKENNEKTEQLLSRECLEYCAGLPSSVVFENGRFVHGCPPDSVLQYLNMISDVEIVKLLNAATENFNFVGHTHKLELVWAEAGEVKREKLKEGFKKLDSGKKYLINCGSVGQPRDGNRKAKYLVWDSDKSCIEVCAVKYDASTTAKKINDLGFPAVYGTRLL